MPNCSLKVEVAYEASKVYGGNKPTFLFSSIQTVDRRTVLLHPGLQGLEARHHKHGCPGCDGHHHKLRLLSGSPPGLDHHAGDHLTYDVFRHSPHAFCFHLVGKVGTNADAYLTTKLLVPLCYYWYYLVEFFLN